MKVLELNKKISISDQEILDFNLTTAQVLFLEEYLSNGMKSTDAARYSIKTTSPDVYQKNEDNKRYFSMRASTYMKAAPVANFIEYYLKKSKASTLEDVLLVVSNILNDENGENKDRLKAAELLLKHYGAFEKHQAARADKKLTINAISSLSDKELEDELRKRLTTVAGGHKTQFDDIEEVDYED